MKQAFDWSRILFPEGSTVSAYEVLDRVKEIARQEPKRIRMSGFLVRKTRGGDNIGIDWPRCGTVGCVSGWARVVTRSAVPRDSQEYALGLTDAQARELFWPRKERGQLINWNEGGQFSHVDVDLFIQHVQQFQDKYDHQLKSHLIRVPRVATTTTCKYDHSGPCKYGCRCEDWPFR